MFNRRTLLLATAGLPLISAHAQVSDIRDAINKAGRQRMLSQRMGKAWLALVLMGVEKPMAQQVLDKSLALFDRQLVELKAFAASADIASTTYNNLDASWSAYKTALVGNAPSRDSAATMLQLNAGVLALAHQGTVQFESAQGKPLGKLVNIAGRQRMLSQRMAMYYLAARLPVDAPAATAEINKAARTEFLSVRWQTFCKNAPEDHAIADQGRHLQLAETQWMFFDRGAASASAPVQRRFKARRWAMMFVTSENMLSQ